MDIWTYVICAVAFYISFRLGQASILSVLKRELRERIIRGEVTEQQLRRAVLDGEEAQGPEETMKVERVEGQYFAYGDSLGFLAQGDNFREMFDRIKHRFPGHSFRIRDYQTSLTEEESGRLLRAVFEVFGDKNEQKSQ